MGDKRPPRTKNGLTQCPTVPRNTLISCPKRFRPARIDYRREMYTAVGRYAICGRPLAWSAPPVHTDRSYRLELMSGRKHGTVVRKIRYRIGRVSGIRRFRFGVSHSKFVSTDRHRVYPPTLGRARSFVNAIRAGQRPRTI